MPRIRHLSLSPEVEAALLKHLIAEFPTPRRFPASSMFAALIGVIAAAITTLAAWLVFFIHR